MRLFRTLAICLMLSLLAQDASAAIINAANRRTVKTRGFYRISTNTRGQRQIAITIDPWITMEFQLDVTYPQGLVEPEGFAGFNQDIGTGGLGFEGPYIASGDAPHVLIGGDGPVVNNIHGGAPRNTPASLLANNPTGGSDLFTLYFVDLAPTQTKVFTILGTSDRGIDPVWERFIEDNYLDIVNPDSGVIERIWGANIERSTIEVPGIGAGGEVPLPSPVWMGILTATGILIGRRKSVITHATAPASRARASGWPLRCW